MINTAKKYSFKQCAIAIVALLLALSFVSFLFFIDWVQVAAAILGAIYNLTGFIVTVVLLLILIGIIAAIMTIFKTY